ncbi:unnamed protein product [Caenorhabditis nigoni]
MTSRKQLQRNFTVTTAFINIKDLPWPFRFHVASARIRYKRNGISSFDSIFDPIGSCQSSPANVSSSPPPMSQSTSRVFVADANPINDVPMEDASGPVVPAVVAPAKGKLPCCCNSSIKSFISALI